MRHRTGRARYRKSLVFFARDRSDVDYKLYEGAVEISIVEVLENPSNFAKGELRPAVADPKANPYRTLQFEKSTGAQIVIIPIILYTDKFSRGEGNKTGMAGYYWLPIGMKSHYRSGAQTVRIASATSDGMDADVPILASIDDIQRMENDGKLMHTAR